MKIFNLAEELEKERKKNKELEEENIMLEKQRNRENNAVKELKNRIDKSIEYIEKDLLKNKIENVNWDFDEVYFSDLPVERIEPLIEILKGDKQ